MIQILILMFLKIIIKKDFFNNINATTLKITKCREINIHKIKNIKLGTIIIICFISFPINKIAYFKKY